MRGSIAAVLLAILMPPAQRRQPPDSGEPHNAATTARPGPYRLQSWDPGAFYEAAAFEQHDSIDKMPINEAVYEGYPRGPRLVSAETNMRWSIHEWEFR